MQERKNGEEKKRVKLLYLEKNDEVGVRFPK